MIVKGKNILIIAPHPDDETLGVGGTIARFAKEGANIYILIVCGHLPPLYKIEDYKKTQNEATKVFKKLKVKDFKFLDIPATKVNEVPVAELNSKISNYINSLNPEIVFIPFPDRHIDHRIIFDSSLVCCRPTHINSPKIVLAYETLSETFWNAPNIEANFVPELFIDITNHIDLKKEALKMYKSQLDNVPSRSIDAATALARFRGSQNGCEYAESFKVVRYFV
ncbi:PIG-L family deacetylase [Pelagibacterales bacterium]|nr:PIG-L family deacetylase [Pelagibacterales bacterium]